MASATISKEEMKTSYARQSSAHTNLEKQGRILCSAEIRRMKHNSTFYATQLKWGTELFNFFQKKGNGQAKRSLLLIGTCLDCGVVLFTMTLKTHSSLKIMGCISHQHGHLGTEDAVAWPIVSILRITWAE